MPIQVERRPSESLDGIDSRSMMTKQQQVQQQQQQQQQLAHREALRLALGSILTPKRPSSASANPSSRPSSGTASPAYPFGAALGGASGTHTPVGTPPVGYGYGYYPLPHGPNAPESTLLHPHYGHGGYYAHGHGHQPSRLGPSRSVSSATPSPSNSAPTSAHPSPRPGAVSPPTSSMAGEQPVPSDIEPLPPSIVVTSGTPHDSSPKPVRPPIMPLHPSKEGHFVTAEAADEHKHEEAASSSGSSTPRSKFLQTLQSKSAWDALIHGSFS